MAQYDANCARMSYDVRIWKVQVYKRKSGTRYGVRWFVAGDSHHDTFTARALADGFRADLLSAARKGTPFDIDSGFPIGMLPAAAAPSWFEHACAFVDSKWTRLAPRSRQSIADGLATVTPALVRTDRGRPSDDMIREVLYGWAFNTTRRRHGQLPDKLRNAADWMAKNTLTLDAIDDPPVVRRALETLATRGDGKQASGNTVARRRAAFSGALNYAVELGHLPVNPLTRIRWKAPKAAEAIDPRSVINHEQAKALLKAVGAQGRTGKRLVGFFACMYYAAMRPAEVTELHERDLVLPDEGWGELRLSNSTPASGRAWTDRDRREARQLKHRAVGDIRLVPCPPQLVAILQQHLTEHGTAPDGRLFRGARGGPVPDSVYGRIWQKARKNALTAAEAASPLAERPYDLRHAAVSTWLNAGVDPTQVAEWAGHSVNVLLRVYAKCIAGRDGVARQRIERMLDEAGGPDVEAE